MVTLDDGVFNELLYVARRRNISMQELFRVVVIPDRIELNVIEDPPLSE